MRAGRRKVETDLMANNLHLRDVTESDLPIFFQQQLDPEATAMAAFPTRDRESFMAHWAKIMADETNILKTIIFDDSIAGNIVSWEQSGEQEIGYWIGKEFWGKGIATKALSESLSHIKTRPIYAHVAKHNIASQRVLEKCGFAVIGSQWILDEEGNEMIEEFILKLE